MVGWLQKAWAEKPITVGLGLVSLALIANVVVSYRATRVLIGNEARVKHTRQVLTELDGAIAGVTDAETGQRGYIITGQEEYLKPYSEATRGIQEHLDALRSLTADNPVQQSRLDALEGQVKARLFSVNEGIRLRREQGIDAAGEWIRTGRGRKEMEAIRATIAAMRDEEERLLAIRLEEARASGRNAILTFIVASAMAFAFLTLVYVLIQRRAVERGRAAEALRESEERYRLLFERNPMPMWVYDPETLAFLTVNEAAIRHYGYTRDEFLAMTIADIRPPEDVPALRQAASRSAPGLTQSGVWKHRRKDGSIIHVEITSHELAFIGRRAKIVLACDITERRQAEQLIRDLNLSLERRVAERTAQLEETNKKLEAEMSERQRGAAALQHYADEISDLYHNAPCGYHSVNPEGVIVRINDTELKWLGYAREEVVGKKKFSDLVTPETKQVSQENFPRLKGRGWVNDLEFDMVRKDGSILPVLLNSTAIRDAEGNFVMGRSTIFNMTEIKRARDEIRKLNEDLGRRAGELEAINQELEAFTYSVSHDLRAPLRHVSGFVQLLRKREGERLEPTSARYLRVISEGAAKMGALIDDLLAFSRTGRAEVKTARVELAQLVGEARRELAPMTRERSITWQVGKLPAVEADPGLLKLVIVNLLSNAVKYTGARPEARIEVGTLPGDNGEVTVFVRDNGVGFDMQYAHKLFGVFQRLHREEEFPGTGIGLATVRRIISRHGGRVWGEGRPDKGAVFYFTLKQA